MKRRKKLLKVIAYLTHAQARWTSSTNQFFDDPVTHSSGCAGELQELRRKKWRYDILKRVHELSGNKSPFVTMQELERYGWKGRQHLFLDDVAFHNF